MKNAPLCVITGPTASGKSALALRLAERWGGEIICADSRTVYRDMNIGTAKPSPEDQLRVRHWLLDVVNPGERFTAADFQKLAYVAIDDIRKRGKVPFLVGGTGLYIDAVILDFTFGGDVNEGYRRELEKMSIEQLQSLIKKQQLVMPENKMNKRYLIRCLEKDNTLTSRKHHPTDDAHVVAIDVPKPELEERLRFRIRLMFDKGLLQETQQLIDKYGSDNEAMTGNIYPIAGRFLAGDTTREQAEDLAVISDRRLAKRQRTWQRRHYWVRWMSASDAEQYFDNLLLEFRDD